MKEHIHANADRKRRLTQDKTLDNDNGTAFIQQHTTRSLVTILRPIRICDKY